MTQETVAFGATQVAEPPAPLLPVNDEGQASDNRRKLMIAAGVGGALVLAIVAFFLLKGGGSASSDNAFVVPHHKAPAPAAPAASKPVKLPKHVKAPVGRDPFKALYVAPVAAPAGAAAAGSTTTTSGSTTPTTSTTGTTTTTTSAPKYKPVWVQLKGVTGSTVTFIVGYSNGKSLKALRYSVTASTTHAVSFAGLFALESLRNGVATVKFGDGSPFQLDRTHNVMVVG